MRCGGSPAPPPILYQDGPRYWYSTQPTVTKLAEDRAEQLKRDPDKVVQELDNACAPTCAEGRLQPHPPDAAVRADVPDDLDARLVVLGVDHAYSREAGNAAEAAAKAIFETRGNTPRLYRNTLVFLAADKTRLQDLDEAVRRYLAWESILDEKETLNLDPHQVKQAETQKTAADGAVTARLPETYQWLLVPAQATPQAPVEWQAIRLSGQDALAVRASKKLRSDELLGHGLRRHAPAHGAGPGAAVARRSCRDQAARRGFRPLPLPAASQGAGGAAPGHSRRAWPADVEQDAFAYAESYDEAAGRYRGLRCGQMVAISANNFAGLLVKPDIAQKQSDTETEMTPPPATDATWTMTTEIHHRVRKGHRYTPAQTVLWNGYS